MISSIRVGAYLIAVHLIVFVFTTANYSSIAYFNCISDSEEEEKTICRLPDIARSQLNNTLMRLPDNLPYSTTRLDIFGYQANETSIGIRMPIELIDVNIFKRFSSLQSLLIIGSKLEVPEELRYLQHMSLFKEELFNVSSLKVLALSISMPTLELNATDNTTWILPKNLLRLGVEKTIMQYDLRRCSKLEEIFVGSSPLTRLPQLSLPPPPIKQLQFEGCPLSELNVEDVAGFCRLQNFSVVSFDAPFNVDMDKCECIRLLRWIRKLTQMGALSFDGGFPCDENTTGVELCLNASLSEAIRLRKKCLGESHVVIIFFGVAIAALPFVFAFSVFIRSFEKVHVVNTTRSPSVSKISEEMLDAPEEMLDALEESFDE